MSTPIYVEHGAKRHFACAVDWPGWCRVGKGEAEAIAALGSYADRYAIVADEAGVTFDLASSGDPAEMFEVIEHVEGSGATDFGVPERVADADRTALSPGQAQRQAALVAAAWRVFDRVVAAAPAELRKGPRGGGRDRDQIVVHVVESERSYARKLGVRYTPSQFAEPGALQAMRDDIVAALSSARDGEPSSDKGWPARYAARRIAWHVLDHAWEIQDKSEA